MKTYIDDEGVEWIDYKELLKILEEGYLSSFQMEELKKEIEK